MQVNGKEGREGEEERINFIESDNQDKTCTRAIFSCPKISENIPFVINNYNDVLTLSAN